MRASQSRRYRRARHGHRRAGGARGLAVVIGMWSCGTARREELGVAGRRPPAGSGAGGERDRRGSRGPRGAGRRGQASPEAREVDARVRASRPNWENCAAATVVGGQPLGRVEHRRRGWRARRRRPTEHRRPADGWQRCRGGRHAGSQLAAELLELAAGAAGAVRASQVKRSRNGWPSAPWITVGERRLLGVG